MKTTTCIRAVPAILSPTGAEIAVGTVVQYKRVFFRNGEHHLQLADGKSVAAIFFAS